MEAGVAEQLVEHPHPLHEQADVIFVRHADAAVHLHRLLHRQFGDAPGLGLGHRNPQGGIRSIGIQRRQRPHNRRPRDLDLAEQMGRAMLQGLELADQLAELFAGPQIGHGRLEGLIPRPIGVSS